MKKNRVLVLPFIAFLAAIGGGCAAVGPSPAAARDDSNGGPSPAAAPDGSAADSSSLGAAPDGSPPPAPSDGGGGLLDATGEPSEVDAAGDALVGPDVDAGSLGAPCSGTASCVGSTCSPITKTCGGCFAEGQACGNAMECCGGYCNTKTGLCGSTIVPLGAPCADFPADRCVDGAYCNLLSQRCVPGCETTSYGAAPSCPTTAICDTTGLPSTNGFCIDVCTTPGSATECAASLSGTQCTEDEGTSVTGTSVFECGCYADSDCLAGEKCTVYYSDSLGFSSSVCMAP